MTNKQIGDICTIGTLVLGVLSLGLGFVGSKAKDADRTETITNNLSSICIDTANNALKTTE